MVCCHTFTAEYVALCMKVYGLLATKDRWTCIALALTRSSSGSQETERKETNGGLKLFYITDIVVDEGYFKQ